MVDIFIQLVQVEVDGSKAWDGVAVHAMSLELLQPKPCQRCLGGASANHLSI